jgi:D-sedoheptulose 7-phosphate isomerase
MGSVFSELLREHLSCMEGLRTIETDVVRAGQLIVETLQSRHKILICGNGGSAAEAQHFAAELVGRFGQERKAYPALALTTDTSILTAVANDYSFETIFSRQIEGLGHPGDVLIGLSTSGASPNILRAVETAREMKLQSIGLMGRDGGGLGDSVDMAITVPHGDTARIQEAHQFILHFWAAMLETVHT